MEKEKQKKEEEKEEVSANIIKTDYSEMMSRSYIDYAMSVITDRAVPDVRDGLKPVQRRILYDMGCELHLSPNGPYRKSARIVGDTMGKFHPHGDSSIYDAMVVMSQDFKKEVPLIDGHGNFGSIEGDGAAASRYCLAGDMRINTNLGLIKMEDIVPESQLNSDNEINIKVVSLFEHVEVADKLFNSGIHRTKRITLDNGMTFRGSFNHPIAIIKDGSFQWKTLSHLKVGDVVIVPLNVKNLSNRHNISDADIFDCAVSTAGELEDIDEEIILSDSSIQCQFIGHCFGIGAQIKTVDKIPSLFLRLSDGAAKDMQLLLQMQGVLSSIRSGGVFIDSSSSLKAFYENVSSLDKCGEVLARRRDTNYEPYPFNETYAFVPVSRIENTGMEPVYSVRVRSKDHSFTACGVINHNTEARLTPISEEAFINDVSEDTVSFAPNYDETTKEPEILPALIPNFIINGSEGIAVGMTTSTPPHNLSEAIACEKYLMKHPAAKTEALMRYVSGPDFPTGGIIINKKDLESIYETGQGKIKIRGKIEHETKDENGKSINRLVITEIPYTMIGTGISKFLCDLSELADKREIPDIVDISNQSSKDGIRIVIDLKKSADLATYSLTGYSGGGKKMIATYEAEGAQISHPGESPRLFAPRPYALGHHHKHLPEMQLICGLTKSPIFNPVVGPFYKGMAVSTAIFQSSLSKSATAADIQNILAEHYAGSRFVKVLPYEEEPTLDAGSLNPTECNGTNEAHVYVFGKGESIQVSVIIDNLGKGASGAAIQNMNIALGIDEGSGLSCF